MTFTNKCRKVLADNTNYTTKEVSVMPISVVFKELKALGFTPATV